VTKDCEWKGKTDRQGQPKTQKEAMMRYAEIVNKIHPTLLPPFVPASLLKGTIGVHIFL
jgi:hypothetical protein